MDQFISLTKKLAKQCAGLFPSALPVGMQDFDTFCESIFETYSLPDNPSYRQAIASMIMHLGPTKHRAPKLFFARSIKKAMANQIAFENIQRLKKQEQEYIKQFQIEATTAPHEEPNGPEGASEILVSATEG